MQPPLIQIAWKGQRIRSVTPDHVLDVWPEDGAPKGRKAACMAEMWEALRGSDFPGVIWMDPDIVADPVDLEHMHRHIQDRPDAVHVAHHRLWPASTGRDTWVWGHGRWDGDRPEMTQDMRIKAEWFAMGFTYTPRILLDRAWAEMPFWHYGQTDMGLSRIAREYEVPMWAILDCVVKHLHFTEGDDYLEWTRPCQ